MAINWGKLVQMGGAALSGLDRLRLTQGRAPASSLQGGGMSGLAAMIGGTRGRKINPVTGLPYRRSSRGLSGRDLKGFNKTIGLLKRVGMVPRRLGGRARIPRRRRF